MTFPDSYLDDGNPWTTDSECCAECGKETENYALIDSEPMCQDCEHSIF